MLGRILAEPEKFWTAEEIIAYTKKHFQTHFVTVTGSHFSDTNYVLLGLIIERLCGQPATYRVEGSYLQPAKDAK